MQWNTYRPSERTRRDKPVPKGFISINDKTGAMRIGDGRTLLDDLESVGGSAFRAIKYTAHAADKVALHAGVVIGQLQQGEWPFNINVMVETAFDGAGAPILHIDTGGVSGVMSNGPWSVDVVDPPVGGGAAGSGLLTPAAISFPVQQNVAPPGESLDIVLKVVKADESQLASNAGLVHVVLTIGVGY